MNCAVCLKQNVWLLECKKCSKPPMCNVCCVGEFYFGGTGFYCFDCDEDAETHWPDKEIIAVNG